MTDTTTATAATTTTTAAAAKQFTCGITEDLKNTLKETRLEFTRPAKVKGAPPVPMSEKECLEVLHKVASDRRFKVVEETSETGETSLVTFDLFEVEWKGIVERDYPENTKTPTIDGLVAQIRKYGAALKMGEDAIQAMITAATGSTGSTASE